VKENEKKEILLALVTLWCNNRALEFFTARLMMHNLLAVLGYKPENVYLLDYQDFKKLTITKVFEILTKA
jgi:hypothetical protein